MSLAAEMCCDVGLASLVADRVGLVLGVHVYVLVNTVAGAGPPPGIDEGRSVSSVSWGTLVYFVHCRY